MSPTKPGNKVLAFNDPKPSPVTGVVVEELETIMESKQ